MRLGAELALLLVLAALLARLAHRLGLPALLGMIAAGVVMRNVPALELAGPALETFSAEIRLAILAVVLLRAGLGLSPSDFRRAGGLVLGLGAIPMLGDATLVAVGGRYLLGLSWEGALVLGLVVAAISPAIVITGLLDLLARADERTRKPLIALLASAPLDNILAVVGLGVALDLLLGGGVSWSVTALQLPLQILGGVLAGWVVGKLACVGILRLPPGKAADWTAVVFLWASAGLLIWAGRAWSFSFVLAIIALGATLRSSAGRRRVEGVEVGLASVWSVAQYALFGLIGAAVSLGPLGRIGLAAVGAIALGQLGRALGSWLVTAGSDLTPRERLACVLCHIPKATIQAAFAGLPLDRGLPDGEVILSVGVLAIVLTAPLGVVALHKGAATLLGIPPEKGP